MAMIIYEIPSLIGSALSFGACAWLVFAALPCIPKKYNGRLLIRQLRHLSKADLLMATGGIVMSIVELLPLPVSVGLSVCAVSQYVIWSFFLLGLFTSMLIEIHLGLGILSGARRWITLSRGLSCILPWLWVVGLALAAIDIPLSTYGYDDSTKSCTWEPRYDLFDRMPTPTVAILSIVSCITNGFAYALLTWDSCLHFCGRRPRLSCVGHGLAPEAVETRALKQVWRYCVAALVTWMPFWICWAGGWGIALTWARNPSASLVSLGISLNGAMNVFSYAAHNRHVKRIQLDQCSPGLGTAVNTEDEPRVAHESFHVLFAAAVEVHDIWDDGGPGTQAGSSGNGAAEKLVC